MAHKRSLPRLVAWASIAVILALFARYILPSLIFLILMFSAGGGDSTKQLQRVESPDRFTDAVLIQTIPGFSIEPYGFDVYIKRTDKRGEKDKPILEGGGFKDLKLMWVAPRVLQISYSAGCIGLFRNNWLALDQDNRPYYQDGRPYRIEVRLKSPTDGEPHTCE